MLICHRFGALPIILITAALCCASDHSLAAATHSSFPRRLALAFAWWTVAAASSAGLAGQLGVIPRAQQLHVRFETIVDFLAAGEKHLAAVF